MEKFTATSSSSSVVEPVLFRSAPDLGEKVEFIYTITVYIIYI